MNLLYSVQEYKNNQEIGKSASFTITSRGGYLTQMLDLRNSGEKIGVNKVNIKIPKLVNEEEQNVDSRKYDVKENWDYIFYFTDTIQQKLDKVQHIIDTSKNPNVFLTTEDYRLIMPQNDSILIKCQGDKEVFVKNFYKFANFITKDSSCDFYTEDDFDFAYENTFHTFFISIVNENIQRTINQAERKFLDILNINESQGCLLNVRVSVDKAYQDFAKGTPYYLNKCDKLSFCKD